MTAKTAAQPARVGPNERCKAVAMAKTDHTAPAREHWLEEIAVRFDTDELDSFYRGFAPLEDPLTLLTHALRCPDTRQP